MLIAICATLAIVLTVPVASAHAGDGLGECFDQAEAAPAGETPVCDVDDDGSDTGWSDDPMADDDGFGGFIALMVVVALAGVAISVWKVTTARTLATRSGMDPDLATRMTLLTDNGLDSTYLAANLRQSGAPPASPAPAPAPAPAAQRLVELKDLLDGGLITQAEYDDRRTAVIEGL